MALLSRQSTRGGRYAPAHPSPWLGDPLHMTAQAIVPPGGGAYGLNVNAFRPPTQAGGYVVSAIKFQIQPSVVGSITAALNVPGFNFGQGFSLGAVVTVAFSLVQYNAEVGHSPLPAGPAGQRAVGAFSGRVPIAILCDSRDASSDLLSGGFVAAGAGAAFNLIHPLSEYRWDLPEPFYVPPGWIFIPQLFGLGGNVGGNVGASAVSATIASIPEMQVQVSYEGSLLDPDNYGDDGMYLDDVTRMPFACAYLAPPVPSTTLAAVAAYAASSDETNLVNIFDQPATITRMNGKIIAVPELSDLGDVGTDLLVRMLTGNGLPFVRDRAEWREVFDRQTRGWSTVAPEDAPYTLDPGEFVIANLAGSVATATNLAGVAPVGNYQPMIALTGYRELKRGLFE